MEKRFSSDSSDKSSNNPFMWMMIKQLDRTETRLNKVHTLSHKNHVAINSLKGMLEKYDVTDIKSKVQSLEDCCKKQKTQITSLESNVSTQKRECHSIEKKVTSLLNGFQKTINDMQSEIDDLKKRTCPQDWMRYMGHCYLFVYKKVTWNTAKNECQQKGGYLVKVESAAENSWLILALNAEVWIGLSDIQTEGQWRWTSDDIGISFSYLLSHRPNGGRGENCVNYCKAICGQNAYGWNDLSCNYQLGYVCEKQN